MDTCIALRARADADRLFQLAAAVEDWPRLLPHYRWVRVVQVESSQRRLVEMAARRDVLGDLGVPLWWRSIQTLDPSARRIRFEHVRGITHGMQVEWRIDPQPDGWLDVQIRHVFRPRWPVPERVVALVVGEYFVNGVARRTLAHLIARAAPHPGTPRAIHA
jgi:ribosome-associated toxin RatA of RatAB toxin-antitoxin module